MHNFKLRAVAFLLTVIMLLSLLCSCKPTIEVPEYPGCPYVEINGGEPFFTEDEITDEAFESYSPLDTMGRCGVAFACIGIEIMPTEDRDDISNIEPSGWTYRGVSNNNSYDFVEGGYVYNRCHLIGFQLAGENDNELNLITGTRYMNIEGMLPFENKHIVRCHVHGNERIAHLRPWLGQSLHQRRKQGRQLGIFQQMRRLSHGTQSQTQSRRRADGIAVRFPVGQDRKVIPRLQPPGALTDRQLRHRLLPLKS